MMPPELGTIPWSYRAVHHNHRTINPPTTIPALLTTVVATRASGAHRHSVATVPDLVKTPRLFLSQIKIALPRTSHRHQAVDLLAGSAVALAVAN